jgi:hypothetical protein
LRIAPRRADTSLGLFLVGPLTRPENHAGFLPFQLGLDVLMPADKKSLQLMGGAVGAQIALPRRMVWRPLVPNGFLELGKAQVGIIDQ